MSWDSYIDNLITQTRDANGIAHCDKACIIGLDDGGCWTSTNHPNAVKLQGIEAPNIAWCFKTKDFTLFMTSMVRVEGTGHTFIKEEKDGKIVYVKYKGMGTSI